MVTLHQTEYLLLQPKEVPQQGNQLLKSVIPLRSSLFHTYLNYRPGLVPVQVRIQSTIHLIIHSGLAVIVTLNLSQRMKISLMDPNITDRWFHSVVSLLMAHIRWFLTAM